MSSEASHRAGSTILRAVLILLLAAAGSPRAWSEAGTTGPAPEGAGASDTAAPSRVLRLADAVALALEHSFGLVAAGHAKQAATEGVTQARSARIPQISAIETISRTDNPTMVFSNLLGQARFGPANFAIGSLNEPDPLTNFNTRLVLAQPIYAGGRIDAGISAAGHMEAAAGGMAERARQEAIYQTTRAYQGVLLARAQGEVASAAKASAVAHVRDAENLVETGLAVPSDAMRAKVRLAEIDEMVVRARAGEKVARAGLMAAMGTSPEGTWDVAPPEPSIPPLPDAERSVATALAQRPDLEAARRGESAAGDGVRAARAGWKPQAGFMAIYESNNDTLLGSSGRNWTAMATVSVNLFDGRLNAARVRQSREEQARAAAMTAGFESQVALEVRQAHAELEGALARREAAARAVEEAEQSLRIVRDRYENGLATITDLLDSETALTGARSRMATADYDCRDGAAALELAMGTLGATPEEDRR